MNDGLIEVKADCPRCGSARFVEVRRYRDAAGWLFIKRRCRSCLWEQYVRQVRLSEVDDVRLRRKSDVA